MKLKTTDKKKPISTNAGKRWRGVIDAYRAWLPVTAKTPVISLNEGNTPLIRADNFVSAIGGEFELWLKYEGINPTCSFKDRGMTLAVSAARSAGRKSSSAPAPATPPLPPPLMPPARR